MYVDLAGLARYKSDFGAWARGALLPKDAAAARVRTEKAGAVSLVPVQETPLDVSVDFMFSETLPASGDKGPENPSTITGVSSVKVTRCGKNLCPNNIIFNSQSSFVAITSNADGSLKFNGTVASGAALLAYIFNATASPKKWPPYIKHSTTYSFSVIGDNQNINFTVYRSFNNGGGYGGNSVKIHAGETATWTTPASEPGMIIRIEIPAGTVLDNVSLKFQIEEGSTATSFEPYAGTDYPLPLGNTYYGGTLDVASGVMTVTWGARVFTGQETSFTWGVGTTEAYTQFYTSSQNLYPGRKSGSGATAYCSHFNRLNNSSVHTSIGYGLYGTTYGGYFYYLSSYTTVDDWTIFLASEYANGTPVTVVYQLATPQTVQLSPTEILSLTQSSDYDPRVNTVYGDASAVQVGYLKHPSAASSELRNAIVSLGGGI